MSRRNFKQAPEKPDNTCGVGSCRLITQRLVIVIGTSSVGKSLWIQRERKQDLDDHCSSTLTYANELIGKRLWEFDKSSTQYIDINPRVFQEVLANTTEPKMELKKQADFFNKLFRLPFMSEMVVVPTSPHRTQQLPVVDEMGIYAAIFDLWKASGHSVHRIKIHNPIAKTDANFKIAKLRKVLATPTFNHAEIVRLLGGLSIDGPINKLLEDREEIIVGQGEEKMVNKLQKVLTIHSREFVYVGSLADGGATPFNLIHHGAAMVRCIMDAAPLSSYQETLTLKYATNPADFTIISVDVENWSIPPTEVVVAIGMMNIPSRRAEALAQRFAHSAVKALVLEIPTSVPIPHTCALVHSQADHCFSDTPVSLEISDKGSFSYFLSPARLEQILGCELVVKLPSPNKGQLLFFCIFDREITRH